MRLVEEKDPPTAARYLLALRAGLEAILCRGEEEGYTVGWVLQEVLSGRLRFYHAVEGSEPAGFLLGLVDLRRPLRPTFYVWGLAVDRPDARWQGDLSREVERVARDAGCAAVAARSPRPGWARWARRFGWRPGAVEYTKELA